MKKLFWWMRFIWQRVVNWGLLSTEVPISVWKSHLPKCEESENKNSTHNDNWNERITHSFGKNQKLRQTNDAKQNPMLLSKTQITVLRKIDITNEEWTTTECLSLQTIFSFLRLSLYAVQSIPIIQRTVGHMQHLKKNSKANQCKAKTQN